MIAHVLMIILSYLAWGACDPMRRGKSRLPSTLSLELFLWKIGGAPLLFSKGRV